MTEVSKQFLAGLTRSSSLMVTKRKITSSVAELIHSQLDKTATLLSALSEYSHKVPKAVANPIVTDVEGITGTSLTIKSNGIDHLRFGKIFQGFTSLGEYLAHLPNIPGNTTVHIRSLAYLRHHRFQEVSSKDTMFGFKDAESLDRFGQFMQEKGAFVISGDEFLFGDDEGRPIATLSLNQSSSMNKPLDQFSFELACGDEYFFDEITGILNETTEVRSSVSRLSTITGVGPGGLEITEEDLNPESVKMVHTCFYPWMLGVTVEEYFKDFLESDANVLVLYGDPGTGKSSMLTTAITKLGLSALMTSNSAVAGNPEFLSRLGQKLAGENGKYDLVIVEDADSLMVPRDKGNDALSQLLNATSGISQKLRFKLVLTSNQKDDSNIDPALLRHGRCFDRMRFGGLDQKQADVVRRYLGLPPVEVKPGTYKTLAQLTNMDIGSVASNNDEAVQIISPRFPLRDSK